MSSGLGRHLAFFHAIMHAHPALAGGAVLQIKPQPVRSSPPFFVSASWQSMQLCSICGGASAARPLVSKVTKDARTSVRAGFMVSDSRTGMTNLLDSLPLRRIKHPQTRSPSAPDPFQEGPGELRFGVKSRGSQARLIDRSSLMLRPLAARLPRAQRLEWNCGANARCDADHWTKMNCFVFRSA